jgi:hypothetical protein
LNNKKVNNVLTIVSSLKESAKKELLYIENVLEFYRLNEVLKANYEGQRIIQQMHIRSLDQIARLVEGMKKKPIVAPVSTK